MTVKIFVLGDSFSHHDYIGELQSWPGVLSTLIDCVVYNGSVPGASNDSLFHRYLQMERQYGKPDLTIVQLTYMCRVWYMLENQNILNMEPLSDRYYVTHTMNYKNTNIKPNGFGNAEWEKRIVEYTGADIDQLKSFYDLQHPFHIQEWRTQKEIHLLNSYDKNCVFFSWDIDYAPFITDMKITYFGAVQNLMRFSYKKYWLSSTDNHFVAEGHARLALLLSNKIKTHIQGLLS